TTTGDGTAVRNWIGRSGAWIADLMLFLFGWSAWWLPVVAARVWLGTLARSLRGTPAGAAAQPGGAWVWWGLVLLMAASCALEWTRLYRWEGSLPGHAGGVLGYVLGPLSMTWLGFVGSGVTWIAALVLGTALALQFSWLRLADALGAWVESWRERREERRERAEDIRLGEVALREREQVVETVREQIAEHEPIVIEPAVVEVPTSTRVAKERQQPLFRERADTKLPPVDLLDAAPARQESVTPESLEMTSRLIEKKLGDFGVEVRVVTASPGPVITRYEIEPATGVKGAQIVNLAKDLARSLSLVSIRVVETIPGKTTMALELPNAKRQTIRLAEILGSQAYADAASQLTIGLGKDIVGAPVVADLAKMPHCLVAGTTGAGKSVGINAMILSLLYKAEARDVRLILIDPKMLEMSVYEGIPHLLCPVVTDMKQAANALNWCVGEMERRYKLMSKLGVRNLAGFNKKVADAAERGESIANPFSLTPEAPEPLERLPQIVVVIDELADLMMVVGKKIEELIARLAQKARASGIHLILATQRPSVDVITGLIKANIPTRIAFQVASKIDSRTILDQMGAEALLGQGDMLYLAAGTGLPVRVHGAFVSDDEVHRVVEYLKSQGEPNYVEGLLEGGTLDGDGDAGVAEGAGGGESDPMYDQAVAIVLQHKRASISLVQRHLRIGYNRAARLLEQMEKSGLVSPMASNGNRDLLVPRRDE
ncbi:MAG: DNA translocase FtsK 4TM domain-containing protein, partial [Rubrivivax sp.]|nr:DNA translocase FtsK 4TM domain-containing protein [Rubrivivax sp.]